MSGAVRPALLEARERGGGGGIVEQTEEVDLAGGRIFGELAAGADLAIVEAELREGGGEVAGVFGGVGGVEQLGLAGEGRGAPRGGWGR